MPLTADVKALGAGGTTDGLCRPAYRDSSACLLPQSEAVGGKPGVENMLGHAPPPLTASGLDMRDGHPAEFGSHGKFTSKVLTPRRPQEAHEKHRPEGWKCKPV
jgi:hypothetical protein